MDIILKSIIISLIGTASVNLAYKPNNLPVLVSINIILLVSTLFILKREKDIKSNGKDERKKYLEELNEKNLIKFENMVNNVIDKNDELNDEFKKHMKSITIVLKEGLNESLLRINNTLDKINTSYMEANDKLINGIEEKNKELIDELHIIKLNINENMIKELEIHNKCLYSNNDIKENLENGMKNINNNEEKVIENLENILNKEEENVDNLESLIKRVKSTENNIIYLKDELIEKDEKIIESNRSVINEYKEIQGSMLNELNKLADKNEHIVKLLLDNYKVLNSLI
ncbi:hypothetical protein, partial [Clostridium tarantellae]